MEIEETSTLTHLRAYQNISVFKFIITFSVLFIQFFLVFVSLLQFTTLFFFDHCRKGLNVQERAAGNHVKYDLSPFFKKLPPLCLLMIF